MLLHLLSGRARLLAHLTGWALVALMFFYLISWVRGPEEALVRTAVNLAFMLAVFYGHARWLVNGYLERERFGPFAVYALVLWLGASVLRTAVELRLPGLGLFQSQLPTAGPVKMFLAYAASFFLLLLFSTLYQLLENRRLLELLNRELETRHVEAQLNYLKAQINPHFLFNTLNNIYAAAVLGHPRTADMVLRLSDLLRYVTYDSMAVRVPLEKETAQIGTYLELLQLKSETPLDIRFDVEGDVAGIKIEPVLLLPLVENAVKHGDIEQNPAGFIHIRLKGSPDRLFFRIKNSYEPRDAQKDAAGGIGLDNINRRLFLHYEKRYWLKVNPGHRTYSVELTIAY